MAGVRWVQTASGEIQTGTSKKTVLQILPATNQRALVDELRVSFGGAAPSNKPVLVEIIQQSDAGTSGVARNPVKENESDDETLQITGLEDIDGSPQPTDGNVLYSEFVHTQDVFIFKDKYFPIPVKGGSRLGIAVTSDNDIPCMPMMKGTE